MNSKKPAKPNELPLNIPKTVVFGSSGYLGSAFLSAYSKIHPDCIGTTRKSSNGSVFQLNLLDPDIAPLKLAKTGHKEALILAGITKIDKCETEVELTRKVNVEGTLELIQQLVNEGIRPVFFSSDYVFDGKEGDYQDDANTNAITKYGKQKAEIEARITEITRGDHLVIRLSKVFSLNKGDGSLLDEMASTLVSGRVLRAAFDQIICPTLISDVIKATAALQARGTKGIINLCSPEKWSRYELALALAKALKIDPENVSRVSLDELGFKSRRPKNISMVTRRLSSEAEVTFTPIARCLEVIANFYRGGSGQD